MLPVAFYCICNISARHTYFLSHAEAGDTCQHVVFILIDTADGYVGNGIFLYRTDIGDIRIDYFLLTKYRQKWDKQIY